MIASEEEIEKTQLRAHVALCHLRNKIIVVWMSALTAAEIGRLSGLWTWIGVHLP